MIEDGCLIRRTRNPVIINRGNGAASRIKNLIIATCHTLAGVVEKYLIASVALVADVIPSGPGLVVVPNIIEDIGRLS